MSRSAGGCAPACWCTACAAKQEAASAEQGRAATGSCTAQVATGRAVWQVSHAALACPCSNCCHALAELPGMQNGTCAQDLKPADLRYRTAAECRSAQLGGWTRRDQACDWVTQHSTQCTDWNGATPTCSQALLHLFQVLLQALLLDEQAVMLLLKLLDPTAAHSVGQPAGQACVAPTGSSLVCWLTPEAS